jgi:hypothetical protein
VAPGPGTGFRTSTPAAVKTNRSLGRFPDGSDKDNNCSDFLLQNAITLSAASPAGSNNIKVTSVEGFSIGQKIIIGTDLNSETAVITTIGTTGATTVSTSTRAGTTVIPVASTEGFSAGQTINIDNGADRETAVVASMTTGRRRFGGRITTAIDSITVTLPLSGAHNEGVQVSGSGITLASPLNTAHEKGVQISSNIPTPGEPNLYY